MMNLNQLKSKRKLSLLLKNTDPSKEFLKISSMRLLDGDLIGMIVRIEDMFLMDTQEIIKMLRMFSSLLQRHLLRKFQLKERKKLKNHQQKKEKKMPLNQFFKPTFTQSQLSLFKPPTNSSKEDRRTFKTNLKSRRKRSGSKIA